MVSVLINNMWNFLLKFILVVIVGFVAGIFISYIFSPLPNHLLISGDLISAYPEAIYPNPILTPGVINPNVTQNNIQSTICKAGWTATIRPSSAYTTHLKKIQLGMADIYPSYMGSTTYGGYHNSDFDLSHYEEDHVISLELGGHPTDPKNLWPQSYLTIPNARNKDATENYLHREVCAGRMSLFVAQRLIVNSWYDVYLSMLKGLGGLGIDNDDE